jgi:hypothetical protein
MWELVSGKQPYHDRNLKQLPHEVVNKGLRPVFPANTPDTYKQLAKSCWSPLPRNRPTAAQVRRGRGRVGRPLPRRHGQREGGRRERGKQICSCGSSACGGLGRGESVHDQHSVLVMRVRASRGLLCWCAHPCRWCKPFRCSWTR